MIKPSPFAVTTIEAQDIIIRCMKQRIVPCLIGSPGMGKSDLIRSIGKSLNFQVIDLRLSQCEPTDLLGYPYINETRGKSSYMPFDTFPLEGDSIPDNYKGCILFLDELPHADPAVQKAGFKLILDRMVGNHKLHSKVFVVAAGNHSFDSDLVEEIDPAMRSRMVNIELKIDVPAWLQWARSNDVDYRITSFVDFKPNLLFNYKPDHDDKNFSCPRTWETLSRLVNDIPEIDRSLMPLMVGTVGQGVATEFYTFTQIYQNMLTFDQVVADPKGVTVPTRPDVLYAMTGLLGAKVTKQTLPQVCDFIRRLKGDFQMIALREIRRKDSEFEDMPEFMDLLGELADKYI